jgi:outer membrane protein, heavy metal efflux system
MNNLSGRQLCLIAIILIILLSSFNRVEASRSVAQDQNSQDKTSTTVDENNQSSKNNQDNQNRPALFNNLPTISYSQYVDPVEGVTMESLITEAAQRNAQLLAAQQNVAILRARLTQAGLRPNPTINTQYSTDQIGTREGEYDFDLSFSQSIDLFGRRRQRVKAAQLELDQAERELAFQQLQLSAEIRTQYAEAMAAAESLRFTEQLIALNQEILRATQTRLAEGDVPRIDVNLARVEVNRLRAQKLQNENRVRTALLQLRTFVGLESDSPIKLRSDLTSVSLNDSLNLATLLRAALENRPDLQAARLSEAAAEARIALANREARPNISISGSFTQERSVIGEMDSQLVDVDRQVGIGISISLPIFNRNQGAIAEAAATRIQARHRREFLETTIKRDVALAFTRLQTAREAVDLYRNEILPLSQENLRIVRVGYDLGDRELFDVVAEQRRLIETQQQYLSVLRDYFLATIELERAVGASIR